MSELGVPDAEQLLAITFLVVVGTVIIGAHSLARDLAQAVQKAGIDVWVVDSNASNIRAAKVADIRAIHGSILSDHVLAQLPLMEG